MKTINVVIFCAGPHSRVIVDILKSNNHFNIVGIIDSVKDIGSEFYGYKVIGRQDNLKRLSEIYKFEAGIVGIGDNYLREKIALEIMEQNSEFTFINAISNYSYVSPSAKMGSGNVLMPGVIVNSEAEIKSHCIINTNSSLEHDSIMHDFSSLSCGVTTGGYISLGKYSALALGVTVMDRISIGENVVVGSGSLVSKGLEDNALYYGTPAKFIRNRKVAEKFLK